MNDLKQLEQEMNELTISKKVLELLVREQVSEATELIRDYILSKEYIDTIRDDKIIEMYIYKDGIRKPNAMSYISEYCRNILGTAYRKSLFNLVLNKIIADSYIDANEFFKRESPELIAVNNGILNLKTRELIPFNPKYKFFSKLNINYASGKDCPAIKRFFKTLFKDKKEIKVMQEIFGFLLYKDYFLEKALMFLGGGRNGKGKTIVLMKKFVGEENCAELPLEELEKDIYALGELFNKDANLCGDLSKTALKNTGKFKKLTGRDMVMGARKYLTRVKFVNHAKMIFAANELPLTYDLTLAFFNRWIIIEFPFTFLSKKEIESLDDTTNIRLRDPAIIDKIATKEEMEGLLNWAVDGLDRLLENKSFSYSPSTEETKGKWMRRSDSCLAFIMDCVEQDFESYVSKDDFRQKYAQYCHEHKLTPSSDVLLKKLLCTTVGVSDTKKSDESGKQQHVWAGIKLKEKNG